MSVLKRQLAALIIAAVAGSQSIGADSEVYDIPRGPMPDGVYRILRRAVQTSPQPEHVRRWDLEGLERLRAVPWPDFSELERVRIVSSLPDEIESSKGVKGFRNTWLVPGSGDELIFVDHYFNVYAQRPEYPFRVEALEYADELKQILRYIREDDPFGEKLAEFSLLDAGGYRLQFHHENVPLLHHALGAAYAGEEEMARALIHHILEKESVWLLHAYDDVAVHSFWREMKRLRRDDRAAVLVGLDAALAIYPHSKYGKSVTEVDNQLRRQVEEDRDLKALAVSDPGTLQLEEQIAYYIARFPDASGRSMFVPTFLRFTGMHGEENPADRVVAIGRPAVPQLLKHLVDRRVTRAVTSRRGKNWPVVLRVQDVALECIEKIVGARLYRRTASPLYLSDEESAVRERVIKDIRAWWAEDGQESQMQGYLALLDVGPVNDRLNVLQKIEEEDESVVDSVVLLGRWAEHASGRDLMVLAHALAKRGDFRFLPTMRAMARGESRKVPYQTVWYLLKYGDAGDYRFLREAVRRDIEAGTSKTGASVFAAAAGAVIRTENSLAVPILVDLLGQREVIRTIKVDGRMVEIGWADHSIRALARLTGHNGGYERGDPYEERCAAMDRWTAWWEREGRDAYVKEHPEVGTVLAGD